jgi:hypothetical protein
MRVSYLDWLTLRSFEMADAIEQDTVDETTEVEEKETGSDQKKTGKTFTQEEVNALIAKEKSAWKRSHEKEKGSWSESEQTLRDQLAEQGEVIQSQVDVLKKDLALDELTLELLSEKPPLEQYRFLLKKMEKADKRDIPRTPQGTQRADDGAFQHKISRI